MLLDQPIGLHLLPFCLLVDDICIPFCDATKEIFDGVNERDRFFRPALRSLLVSCIKLKLFVKCSGA